MPRSPIRCEKILQSIAKLVCTLDFKSISPRGLPGVASTDGKALCVVTRHSCLGGQPIHYETFFGLVAEAGRGDCDGVDVSEMRTDRGLIATPPAAASPLLFPPEAFMTLVRAVRPCAVSVMVVNCCTI